MFGASLSHLLASPALYGDAFTGYVSVNVNVNGTGAQPSRAVLRVLEQDRRSTGSPS